MAGLISTHHSREYYFIMGHVSAGGGGVAELPEFMFGNNPKTSTMVVEHDSLFR